jgi:hypothetical protein
VAGPYPIVRASTKGLVQIAAMVYVDSGPATGALDLDFTAKGAVEEGWVWDVERGCRSARAQ